MSRALTKYMVGHLSSPETINRENINDCSNRLYASQGMDLDKIQWR